MRFSTSLLAAGFTASVFAAPVAQFDPQDECEADPAPSSSSAPLAVSSTSTLVPASPTSSVQASSVISISASSSSLASPSSSASDVSPAETSSAIPVSTATVVPVEASTSASTTSAASVATSVAAIATSSSSSAGAQSTGTAKNGTLQWFGANESGAEFGTTNIPGVLGTDYTWPNTSAIQTLIDQGLNIFRIPFLMERLAQGTMTATLDATYLAALTTVVDYVTTAGAYAVIDPHNFGRYDGTVFTSTSDFQTFWTNVATEFKTNDNVIFDCNNEFHDEPSNTIVAELNQACIDGVRAAGATTQYIFVEGTSYTGAWTWVSSGNSDAMGNLTDTSDKIIYEMHQYLDSDGSGTSSTCVSSTIGAERVADATAWLIANGKKGIIGEYAGGANSVCQEAVTGMLDVLEQNSDVWLGAVWWGAGPWWGDYIYGMEPPSGVAYDYYKSVLSAYV